MCQKHKKQSIQTETEKLNNIREAVSYLLRQHQDACCISCQGP